MSVLATKPRMHLPAVATSRQRQHPHGAPGRRCRIGSRYRICTVPHELGAASAGMAGVRGCGSTCYSSGCSGGWVVWQRNWLLVSVLVLSFVGCPYGWRSTAWSSFDPHESVDVAAMREQSRTMFTFAFDNYLEHAFPLDELDPIHCSGRSVDRRNKDNININDVLGNYSLGLVDSLSTLAVMGNRTAFWLGIELVKKHVSFDQDSTVQVFEANIRVLGSLLSAHQLATDPRLNLKPPQYKGELLTLAKDLAVRLLPAFNGTKTGLPHPRVNLRHGVPSDGRSDTCTAGAGTLLLEFGMLSRLVGDPMFESLARRALLALWRRRHPDTGLLGSNIDIQSGKWIDTTSGFLAGVDSIYETVFKAFVLLGRPEYWKLFCALVVPALEHSRYNHPPLFLNVHMATGDVANQWIDSLQAFLPALQVLYGDLESAVFSHAVWAALWRKYGAMPERFNWQTKQVAFGIYPLRPEFAESTYHLYRATKDPFYLRVGAAMLRDIERHAKVRCGYATLHNVMDKSKEDRMESFFLSETLKYLFLLFDESNFLHTTVTEFVFTTEGHPLLLPWSLPNETTSSSAYALPGGATPNWGSTDDHGFRDVARELKYELQDRCFRQPWWHRMLAPPGLARNSRDIIEKAVGLDSLSATVVKSSGSLTSTQTLVVDSSAMQNILRQLGVVAVDELADD
eukprot:m.258201 g.258201  ORF g.258201 m.258201 type:complete len:682 (+) comp19186_c0_seq9:631-2676(+)